MLTSQNGQLASQLVIILIFVVVMYFLLIKPQKKKDKEVADMRSNIQVGDEIVTIGGILGKVVKTKEESIVIQVGADKTKFEIKKWAVSAVEKKSPNKRVEEDPIFTEKKVKPKRLGKKASEEVVEEAKDAVETVENAVENTAEAVETAAENVVEGAFEVSDNNA